MEAIAELFAPRFHQIVKKSGANTVQIGSQNDLTPRETYHKGSS